MNTQPAVQAQEPTPIQAQQPAGGTDEIQAKIDLAIKTASETWKGEIAGLNRRNTELEKQLQEKELEKLSEKERLAKENEIIKAENQKIFNQTIELKKVAAVSGKGLDAEFAKLITGKTDDEISQSLDIVIGHIEKEVAKRTEKTINEKLGGAAPTGGQAPQNMTLQAAYDKAKAEKRHADMIAIQRAATKEGTSITL